MTTRLLGFGTVALAWAGPLALLRKEGYGFGPELPLTPNCQDLRLSVLVYVRMTSDPALAIPPRISNESRSDPLSKSLPSWSAAFVT